MSVRPWATIEAMIAIAATSKISSPVSHLGLEHEEGEQHRRHALRPEPGHERLLGTGNAGADEGELDRDRPGDQQGEGDEDDQRRDAVVEAGGDDQRTEDEEGQHLEDRAGVLGEFDEALGDFALGGAHRDPADEGGDQAVADRHVGEAEGDEGETDRVDPLVAGGEAAAREVMVKPAAEESEGDADQAAEQRLADQLRRFAAGIAAGAGEDEEEEDERQRQAVVEPGLEVERVAYRARHQPRGDDGRGDDRVGRREHRRQQEGLGPAEAPGRAPWPQARAAPS